MPQVSTSTAVVTGPMRTGGFGSSLAMAPATLVAKGTAFCDLDGPLLLRQDRAHPLHDSAAGVHPPEPALWG